MLRLCSVLVYIFLAIASAKVREARQTLYRDTPPLEADGSIKLGCETYVPTVSDLRNDRPHGFSAEDLRGRRWGSSIRASVGGELNATGFLAGKCVTGTWTREQASLRENETASDCLAKCLKETGCLGIFWGQVQTLVGAANRCFLAGVGNDENLMKYPCTISASSRSCPSPVLFHVLSEIAPTLQCWQKLWWSCPVSEKGSASESGDSQSWRQSDRKAADIIALLEHLKSRFKETKVLSLLSRQLRILIRRLGNTTVIARMIGRFADAAESAGSRAFTAVEASIDEGLEGDAGLYIVCAMFAAMGVALGKLILTAVARLWKPRQGRISESAFPEMVAAMSSRMASESTAPSLAEVEALQIPASLQQGIEPDYDAFDEQPSAVENFEVQPEPEPHATMFLPEPSHQPASLGPLWSDSLGRPEAVSQVATAVRRRNRDSTPPSRRPAGISPPRVSPMIQEVVEIKSDDDAFQAEVPQPPSPRARWRARFWEKVEGPSLDSGFSVSVSTTEMEILQFLNHPDVEVVKQVKHVGEKSAQQIVYYCQREGDLERVSDLASKVGLKEGIVRQIMTSYRL
eukprot:TRINITY_DN112593_c0_g1_i1.p1 TRINITY_DN112593_c0_g1~~TRINITY_DN112593_c0_g1_i1.p1  ORF type:complete len:574 (-),score=81.16 TRINITY_DN112593_c0_g1_i1:81-1802(-)